MEENIYDTAVRLAEAIESEDNAAVKAITIGLFARFFSDLRRATEALEALAAQGVS